MTTIRSRSLTEPVDLVEVAGEDGWVISRNGIGVAGRGVWRRVDAANAVDVLAALGDKVVAIGARPFDPVAPWDLVIPSYQVRVEADGSKTETILGTSDFPEPGRPTGPWLPGPVRLVPVDDPAAWCASVARATGLIRSGRVDKIVLSREVDAVAQQPLSTFGIAQRLRMRFWNCYVFNVDGLVGASPELLVERQDAMVRSQPMAGTTRRSDDPATDAALRQALFDSATYRHEHQLTIDMVHDTLLAYTSYLDDEPEPQIVTLANVAHLATRVEGALSSPPASVLELQGALHPTPAVSGRPRDAALGLIAELEGRERGRYGGTVGWVDGAGNGTWAVTIRCAQIDRRDPHHARIHAGCGLVGDSDPARELVESEAKLMAIASVLED